MVEKKWTLDVESNQYDLVSGSFYLVGCWSDGENIKQCVDISLKAQSVDTKHCILDVSDNDIYIYDLYSAFGTFVNNRRLNPMRKECIDVNCELRFGDLNGSLKAVEVLNTTDTFLAPSHRAPRASLSNTSTRLFSSPDVSLLNDTKNDSFDIPETQNIRQRASIENSSILSSSRNQSYDGKSFCDESFIPETQMPSRTDPSYEASELGSNLQKSGDFIRICTQDFNENLFEDVEDDEAMFSSLVIPNIQHKPVILADVSLNMDVDEDASKTLECDGEVESLNCGNQTAKSVTLTDPAQNGICTDRDDVCTPDLFDLPELAHINVQTDTNLPAEKNMGKDNDLAQRQVSEVIGGDGYAEEVDMMATQVFVPIPKQPEVKVTDTITTTNGLSLSGKENIANTDFSLEQTQIFAPVKERSLGAQNLNSTSSDKSAAPTIQNNDDNSSLLAATQIFINTVESNDKSIKSAVKQNLNNTLTSSGINEMAKSEGNFSHEMNKSSSKKEYDREKQACFKKPKLSNKNKPVKESTSSIGSSQSEAEESILCTPKWITDKFDLLSKQRSKIIMKRNLFGSDSEEDSIELNKLDAKKDSKDFDKLLCNLKEIQPPKFVPSKCSVVKQEELTDVRKVSNNKNNRDSRAEVVLENTDKKLEGVSPGRKEKNSPPSTRRSSKEKSKPDKKVESHSSHRSSSGRHIGHNEDREKSEEPKKRTRKISQKDEHTNEIEEVSTRRMTRHSDHKQELEKIEKNKKPAKNVSSKGENTNEIEEAPTRRMTRLKSRTSDMEYDKASSSTSGPTQAKLRKIEQTDEPDINKKRVTRSRSKNDSQESITSIKSTTSSRSSSRKKNAREMESREKIVTDDNTSAKVSNSAKVVEKNETGTSTSTKDHSRKSSAEEPTVAESKKLRNNARILQVAMSMVEPKLFQSLVDNSPGNWCVANDPTDADVLVMDKGNRTLKFLIAMAKGIPIVTSKWLQSFNSTKTVPRGITHFFRDHDFEKRHKFSLFKSLELARSQKVFEGYDFVTTPSILPRPTEIKQIIECAGGKVYDEPPSPKSDQKIYVISSMNDKKYWHKYRRCNSNIRITDSEGVMASVMRQSTLPLDTNVFA